MIDIEALKAGISSSLPVGKPVERLRKFAFIHKDRLKELSSIALPENWGNNQFVLEKYLAIYLHLSITQGKYTTSENQFYTTAGHLQTRYGTPIYLVFQKNNRPYPPWILVAVGPGEQIKAPKYPETPNLPPDIEIPRGCEIAMAHEHILKDHGERVDFLQGIPKVSQMCAIAGAIQWSIYRKLEVPYWYRDKWDFLVPLYLISREDITTAPDLVAPIQVSDERLLVRTTLDPHMAYANARVAVERHDQLPHWLLTAWKTHAAEALDDDSEEFEGANEDSAPARETARSYYDDGLDEEGESWR